MKLTPITFDAAFTDGLLSMEGMGFDWKGIPFVVHTARPLYDFDGTMRVSSVEAGFAVPLAGATRSPKTAAKWAIARLDSAGEEAVRASIAKGLAMRPTTRVTA